MDPVSKAQSSTGITEKQRANLRPWKKGQSGNLSGRPKKNHVTKMYEQILANPNNRKAIKESVLKTLTDGRMSAVLQLREVAERTEGKVADIVDMNVSGSITLEQVLEARKKAGK